MARVAEGMVAGDVSSCFPLVGPDKSKAVGPVSRDAEDWASVGAFTGGTVSKLPIICPKGKKIFHNVQDFHLCSCKHPAYPCKKLGLSRAMLIIEQVGGAGYDSFSVPGRPSFKRYYFWGN